MKSFSLSGLIAAWVLVVGFPGRASEKVVIDFEGLSNEPGNGQQLTDQITNVVFENVSVVTPATIGSSSAGTLSAATSGRSAAFSAGARILFRRPVVQV